MKALLYVQDSCVLLAVGVMRHAGDALNLSVLSKELEARFLMCYDELISAGCCVKITDQK